MEVFTRENRFASAGTQDIRVLLGDNILSSAIFNWTESYSYFLRLFYNDMLGRRVHFGDYNDGTVLLSKLSSRVPPRVIDVLQKEMRIMDSVGAENYVLCGNNGQPVYDNAKNLRVSAGKCLSINELYTTDWVIFGVRDLGTYKPVPPDFDDQTIPGSMVVTAQVFLGLFLCVTAALALWLFLRRDHVIVKFAQPKYLCVVLIG